MSIWNATADSELQARRDRSSRIPDLMYGVVVLYAGVGVLGFPLPDLATVAMLGIAYLRPARFRLPLGTLILLAVLGLGLAVSGELNGLPFAYRRLGHVGLWAGLLVAVGQGRINLMSMARGIGLGIVVGVPASLPSIVDGAYSGRLTGLFGDPNTAGMILVTMGAWAVGIVQGRLRWFTGIAVAAGVLLTFSRTSLLAFAVVVTWAVLSRRFSMWLTVAVLAPIAVAGAGWLEQVRLFGPFETRSGSDLLRERIAEAAAAKLSTTPWYGNGPGTATVTVQELTFFLHNSYDALRIEGGWPALAVMAALVGISFFRAATGPHEQRHPWFEGALIGALVCALSLGEVLLEVHFAACLGALLLVGSVQRNAVADRRSLGDDEALGRDAITRGVEDDAFIARLVHAAPARQTRPDHTSPLPGPAGGGSPGPALPAAHDETAATWPSGPAGDLAPRRAAR